MNAPIFSNHGCRLNMYETEAMKELWMVLICSFIFSSFFVALDVDRGFFNICFQPSFCGGTFLLLLPCFLSVAVAISGARMT